MSGVKRVANRDVRREVQNLNEFEGSSMYARWKYNRDNGAGVYVVYSYGEHFPMYVYDMQTDIWIANTDKYSRTTSKHQSQAHPSRIDKEMDTDELRKLVSVRGLVDYMAVKAESGRA